MATGCGKKCFVTALVVLVSFSAHALVIGAMALKSFRGVSKLPLCNIATRARLGERCRDFLCLNASHEFVPQIGGTCFLQASACNRLYCPTVW